MAFFQDFSDYAYSAEFYRPRTKNIGWLEAGHSFEQSVTPPEALELLWTFCSISVAQFRGRHLCDLCIPNDTVSLVRNGQRLSLGSAEIRVFSSTGDIYAAPNLIYHYVSAHRYRAPEEFLRALAEGPKPPSKEYFERLNELSLKSNPTSTADGPRRRFGDIP